MADKGVARDPAKAAGTGTSPHSCSCPHCFAVGVAETALDSAQGTEASLFLCLCHTSEFHFPLLHNGNSDSFPVWLWLHRCKEPRDPRHTVLAAGGITFWSLSWGPEGNAHPRPILPRYWRPQNFLPSQCQVHFCALEGRTHLPLQTPKSKERCLQRLWVELGDTDWAVPTRVHGTSHGVRWDRDEKGRGEQVGSGSACMLGQHQSPGVRILDSNLVF